MKLLATHAFNCIVLMVKFGRTSCEDIPPALLYFLLLINNSVPVVLSVKEDALADVSSDLLM